MNIHLITSITGFPNGTAAAKRIKMIAKVFQLSGHYFDVYTNVLVDASLNKSGYGCSEFIRFRYLHGVVNGHKSKIKKAYLFVKGMIALFPVIRKFNSQDDIVYIYSQGTLFNVVTILYCKFFGIKTIQEINEWYHREMNKAFQTWVMEGPMVKWSDAAIVISQSIQEEVLRINPSLPTTIIPVLEDPLKYELSQQSLSSILKYVFWMGLVDGYFSDVELIVKALAKSQQQSHFYDFYISGPCSAQSKVKLEEIARELGFDFSRIHLLGYIDEEDLLNYCRNSHFFIVPLWDNKRSEARFPTKIATFMFCGKPVITCNVGEIARNLTDNENALFFNVGDESHLAEKIHLLEENPELYNRLCLNSIELARNKFGYANYKDTLNAFVQKLLN